MVTTFKRPISVTPLGNPLKLAPVATGLACYINDRYINAYGLIICIHAAELRHGYLRYLQRGLYNPPVVVTVPTLRGCPSGNNIVATCSGCNLKMPFVASYINAYGLIICIDDVTNCIIRALQLSIPTCTTVGYTTSVCRNSCN